MNCGKWVKCSDGMPTGYDNWVLAWNKKWPRARLLNWCNVRIDSGHWRNEADDICYLVDAPTHWALPIPPMTEPPTPVASA